MPEEVFGILVTHGSLGGELLRTVETILGPQGRVEVVSNALASAEGLAARLIAILEERNPDRVYFFVDLLGGSCDHACQEARRARPDAAVFTGMNLPMLIEFFYQRDRVPEGELRQRLIRKGREGIQVIG